MATNNKQIMKVKLFSVSSSQDKHDLTEVLLMLEPMALDQRNRQLANGQIVRAEIVQPPVDRKPYWLLDFVRLRFEHGPGRASATQPVKGFDLRAGDGFAEETAMLYDAKRKLLFMQANHFGVRDGAAESYFCMVDANEAYGFELLPALDPTTEARLAKADRFTKFTLKVAPRGISAGLRKADVALGRALDIADDFQAPEIEITLSVGHTKTSMPNKAIREAIRFTQRAIAQAPEAVLKAGVNGKDSSDAEAKSEWLDLIAPKQVWTFDDLETGPDLRYKRDSRFNALERARAEWIRRFA